jgi:hypothetical protein
VIDRPAAAPVVTVIDWVADVRDGELKVSVEMVPFTPDAPRFVKVATPFSTTAVVVPTNEPPTEIAAVTT